MDCGNEFDYNLYNLVQALRSDEGDFTVLKKNQICIEFKFSTN